VQRESGLNRELLNVSVGFSTPDANIPWASGFLAPIAEQLESLLGWIYWTIYSVGSNWLSWRHKYL